MRRLIFYLFAFYATDVAAQDTLYRIDGSHQVVQILETDQSYIQYKPFSNLDGPVFVILNSSVSKIVDKNGKTTIFAGFANLSDSTQAISNVTQQKLSKGRNFVSINVVDLFTGLLTLNYEHTLESGKLSLKFPLFSGYYTLTGTEIEHNESYAPIATILGTGIGLNFYPRGHRPVAYFLGPSVYYRLYNYYQFDRVNQISQTVVGSITGIYFQNGVLFEAGPRLTLNADVGLGYVWIHRNTAYNSDYYEPFIGLRLKVGINVGFRF